MEKRDCTWMERRLGTLGGANIETSVNKLECTRGDASIQTDFLHLEDAHSAARFVPCGWPVDRMTIGSADVLPVPRGLPHSCRCRANGTIQ